MKTKIFMTCFVLVFLSCSFVSAQSTHRVRPGDTLSKIAQQYYNDPSRWGDIYEANQDLIKDVEKIQVGWNLIIPSLNDLKAKDEIEATRENNESLIRLVTGNNYYPFTGEKLPEDGMLTEVVVEAFEKMGKKVELEFWSWKHGYEATKEGRFTATFPYFKDKEREQHFYYSNNPLYTLLIWGFVQKDSSIQYQKPEDLAGLTVCNPEGYTNSYIQDFLDSGILTLKRPEDMIACFKLLNQGDVDIVSTNEVEAKGIMIKEFGSSRYFKKLSKSFAEKPLYLIFPKSKPDNLGLLYEFDQVYQDMAENGSLQRITKRHMTYYNALIEE